MKGGGGGISTFLCIHVLGVQSDHSYRPHHLWARSWRPASSLPGSTRRSLIGRYIDDRGRAHTPEHLRDLRGVEQGPAGVKGQGDVMVTSIHAQSRRQSLPEAGCLHT